MITITINITQHGNSIAFDEFYNGNGTELEHKATKKFQELLNSYSPSEEAQCIVDTSIFKPANN